MICIMIIILLRKKMKVDNVQKWVANFYIKYHYVLLCKKRAETRLATV